MKLLSGHAQLDLDPGDLRRSFDREPFGFTHNLSGLDLFEFNSLHALAEKYNDHAPDYYVTSGAPSPGSAFYSVPKVYRTPHQAIERLESGAYRILMKRPENHDSRFRELLEILFHQVVDRLGGLGSEKVVRLESAILISSAATTTPFEFDPEIGFFSQIEGEKMYHLYPPADLTEAELERFYVRGIVNIGQVDLQRRHPDHEYVFALGPGKGLHQPQNAPHWVETCETRSISYTFVFETDVRRASGRVRAFNHCLRTLRWNPSRPGTHPSLDAIKSGMMQAYFPVRRGVGRILRKSLGR